MARTYEVGGQDIGNAEIVCFVGTSSEFDNIAATVPTPRFYEDPEDPHIAVCDVVFTSTATSEVLNAKEGARVVQVGGEQEPEPPKAKGVFRRTLGKGKE